MMDTVGRFVDWFGHPLVTLFLVVVLVIYAAHYLTYKD